MGMYDRVHAQCACGGIVEFQSKAGDCTLQTYLPNNVPTSIALDILNKSEVCNQCNAKLTFSADVQKYVNMKVCIQK